VGNLPWSTSADDLDRLFSREGRVVKSSIARRKGRSKGYGFVEMSGDNAKQAIASLDSTQLNGRKLVVRQARPGPTD
jgi:RNA recognition motif-containing protein